MNQQFLLLPETKKQAIINAGFEVFANNSYKKASTEEIAYKAGIAKGSLFYYFHNKKTFYLFLYEKASLQIKQMVVDEHYFVSDDFFERLIYAAFRKVEILIQSPYLFDFILRSFQSQNDEVSLTIQQKIAKETELIYQQYFQDIDLSKFNKEISPQEILNLLVYAVSGYVNQLQKYNQPLSVNKIMDNFIKWTNLLKKVAYKEEYL